ncbi:MAG: hypothetical protein ACRYFK_14325 [Janthinobacterium lividum]
MDYLAPAAQYAPAGLRALLVGPWVAGASYVYASTSLDTLLDLDPAAVWWPVDCQQAGAACEFGEAYAPDKNGPGYTQTITLGVPGLLVALRAGLQLLTAQPLLALCQDMRGQWWLYGQDGALRLPAYAAKGGPLGGESLTSWSLTGRQPAAARLVTLGAPVQVVTPPTITQPGAGTTPRPHTLPFTLA